MNNDSIAPQLSPNNENNDDVQQVSTCCYKILINGNPTMIYDNRHETFIKSTDIIKEEHLDYYDPNVHRYLVKTVKFHANLPGGGVTSLDEISYYLLDDKDDTIPSAKTFFKKN